MSCGIQWDHLTGSATPGESSGGGAADCRLPLYSLDLTSSSTTDRILQLGPKIVCKCIYILYLQLLKAHFITDSFYD